MSPILLIGVGIVVLVLGIGLGLWIGNIGRGKELARTAEIKAELDDYRKQVSEHFNTTALHFESIGAEYRRLYEHMAAGAGSLCDFRPSVFAQPVEQIAIAEVAEEEVVASPPRDYEEPVPDDDDPDEEIIAAATTAEPEPELPEPSDDQLKVLEESESAREILAEHEIAAEKAESEKTIH